MAAPEESRWVALKLMLHARRKLTDPTSNLVRKSVGVMMGAILATKMETIPGIKDSMLLVLCLTVVLGMATRVLALFAFGAKMKTAPPTVDVVASNLTFAWSAYSFLEHVILTFLLGCNEEKPAQCEYQVTFGCAVAASAMLYVLVHACDAIQDDYNEKHNKMAAKFGKLCLSAAPLVLGWTWKDFMWASERSIKEEDEDERFAQGAPDALRVMTIFALLVWIFHMYNISARTARRRNAPESNSEYEQLVLKYEDRFVFPFTFLDSSLVGDLLEFADQTAVQMMAWELKGVVDHLSTDQGDGAVVLVALGGVLLYALLQCVDKMATTPERWAVASQSWKLCAQIHRRFVEAVPLGVGIGVSKVCERMWGHACAVVYGHSGEIGVIEETFEQQLYFLTIAILASMVLLIADSCGRDIRTYRVVSLDSNKQVEGKVFSGNIRDAYKEALESFSAKRQARQEGGEGAPVIARLYGPNGRVLEEFSDAGARWKQLDNWFDDHFHLEETHGSGLVAQAGEDKYKPLSEANSQG